MLSGLQALHPCRETDIKYDVLVIGFLQCPQPCPNKFTLSSKLIMPQMFWMDKDKLSPAICVLVDRVCAFMCVCVIVTECECVFE